MKIENKDLVFRVASRKQEFFWWVRCKIFGHHIIGDDVTGYECDRCGEHNEKFADQIVIYPYLVKGGKK